MTDARTTRPGVVTFIVVLTYISGLVGILLGILAIFSRYLPEVVGAGSGIRFVVTLTGAAIVLFGLLTVSLASGVARGERFSRWGVSGLLLLSLVLTIVDFAANTADGPAGMLVQAAVTAAVILPLWLGRGGRYFTVGGTDRGATAA